LLFSPDTGLTVNDKDVTKPIAVGNTAGISRLRSQCSFSNDPLSVFTATRLMRPP
jgi:hypothetical protein